MTVFVADGWIHAVDPAARARIPADAQQVDGTGKFLIPGLWDMHEASGDHAARDEWRMSRSASMVIPAAGAAPAPTRSAPRRSC